MKKGRKRRNWKRRYFVLSDDWSSISYYEDERCLKERGRVNLGGARGVIWASITFLKRAHVFAFTVEREMTCIIWSARPKANGNDGYEPSKRRRRRLATIARRGRRREAAS